MGVVDNVVDKAQDAAENVQEEAGEAVENVKDAAKKKIDEAKNTAEEVTNQDLDGDGKVGDSRKQSSGGNKNKGSGRKGSGSKGRSGGSGKKGSGSDFAGKEILESKKDQLAGKEKPPGKKKLPNEKDKVEKAQELRESNPITTAIRDLANPGTEQALEAREQNLEARNELEESIEEVRNAPENAQIQIEEGEQVSREEAISKLESKKKEVEQTLEKNQDAFQRSQNPNRYGPNNNKIKPSDEMVQDVNNLLATDGRTTKSVEEEARSGDLDNLKVEGSIPMVGDRTLDFTVKGAGATALASFDTFTSPRGFKQLSTVFTEKEGSQFIKENVVESRRQDNYNVVREAGDVAGSPPGVALTATGIGAGFKTGTTALAAQGGKTAAAGKAIEGAAAASGIAYAANEGRKSVNKIKQGKQTEGVANLLKLGTEFGGFAKGARGASRYLSPSIRKNPGGTKVIKGSQRNRIVQVKDESFTGTGKFQGRFNVKAPKISEKLGIAESGKGRAKAKFSVFGDKSSSQAAGKIQVKTPGGQTGNQRKFEAVNIAKDQSKTPSGKDVTNVRSQVEIQKNGRFFRSTENKASTSRVVKQTDRNQRIVDIAGNTKEINAKLNLDVPKTGLKFKGEKLDTIKLSQEGRVIETTSNTRTDSGNLNTISKARTLVRESGADRGGAGGTGVRGTTDSGTGRLVLQKQNKGFGNNVRGNLNDFSSQIGKGIESALKIDTGISKFGGGSPATGREAAAYLNQFQREQSQASQQTQTERIQVDTGDSFQISRTETGQKILGSRGGEGQVQETGSGSQTERRSNPRNIQSAENIEITDTETKQIADQELGLKQKTTGKQVQKQVAQPKQINTPGLRQFNQTTPKVGVKQFQKIGPKLSAKTTKITSNIQTPITTTPTTTTRTGIGTPQTGINAAQFSNNTSTNTDTFSRGRSSINLDILSANRAELETGSKTFNINQASRGNQTPFSGGVKTVEEKQLQNRKYFTGNQDRRLF